MIKMTAFILRECFKLLASPVAWLFAAVAYWTGVCLANFLQDQPVLIEHIDEQLSARVQRLHPTMLVDRKVWHPVLLFGVFSLRLVGQIVLSGLTVSFENHHSSFPPSLVLLYVYGTAMMMPFGMYGAMLYAGRFTDGLWLAGAGMLASRFFLVMLLVGASHEVYGVWYVPARILADACLAMHTYMGVLHLLFFGADRQLKHEQESKKTQ